MRPHLFICMAAMTAALGCRDKVISPACNVEAPVQMEEFDGIRYPAHLQDALDCSRATGRPVFLVFAGYAVMGNPEAMWAPLKNEAIQEFINDRLILCVLMVDDNKAISPNHMEGFPALNGNPLTLGQRNTMLEREYFSKQSQPLYTLVNADMTSLAEPLGYVPNANDVADWIEATLENLQ